MYGENFEWFIVGFTCGIVGSFLCVILFTAYLVYLFHSSSREYCTCIICRFLDERCRCCICARKSSRKSAIKEAKEKAERKCDDRGDDESEMNPADAPRPPSRLVTRVASSATSSSTHYPTSGPTSVVHHSNDDLSLGQVNCQIVNSEQRKENSEMNPVDAPHPPSPLVDGPASSATSSSAHNPTSGPTTFVIDADVHYSHNDDLLGQVNSNFVHSEEEGSRVGLDKSSDVPIQNQSSEADVQNTQLAESSDALPKDKPSETVVQTELTESSDVPLQDQPSETVEQVKLSEQAEVSLTPEVTSDPTSSLAVATANVTESKDDATSDQVISDVVDSEHHHKEDDILGMSESSEVAAEKDQQSETVEQTKLTEQVEFKSDS